MSQPKAAVRWWQADCRPIHAASMELARQHQAQLTKPPGALGELESLAIRLAGMQGRVLPQIQRPRVVVFAGDHGIVAEGVSAYPQEVTAQMVANFVSGGAAISVLARQIQASLEVVDVGVNAPTGQWPGVVQAKVAWGTAHFGHGPAMTEQACEAALQAGRDSVTRACQLGVDCLLPGEMGIGNTSSASAMAAALLQTAVQPLTGPGTGLAPGQVSRKAQVLQAALQTHAPFLNDPWQVLQRLGGFELAALCGAFMAAAQAGLPVLVDGLMAGVSALVACRLQPQTRPWLLFSHLSAEPAHALLLEALQARPLLQLGMRLGEGSGAACAYALLPLACALHAQMASFSQAGVSTTELHHAHQKPLPGLPGV
jgi:nicotinate-nucleotide--dimethylbenzimidazole phosphoribosyltransferase